MCICSVEENAIHVAGIRQTVSVQIHWKHPVLTFYETSDVLAEDLHGCLKSLERNAGIFKFPYDPTISISNK